MAKASASKPVSESNEKETKKAAKKTVPVKKAQTRSENFKDGVWDLKYLQFVYAFITQTGMTSGEAATKGGITRQTLYHWFNTDDAKISSIIKFINNCGYTIKFALKPETNKIGDALVTINSKDNFETVGDKNLSFLDEALDRYGIIRKDVAAKLGIGYTALYFWFRHDDVFISYIYRIAEQNGLKVVIKIDPKDK